MTERGRGGRSRPCTMDVASVFRGKAAKVQELNRRQRAPAERPRAPGHAHPPERGHRSRATPGPPCTGPRPRGTPGRAHEAAISRGQLAQGERLRIIHRTGVIAEGRGVIGGRQAAPIGCGVPPARIAARRREQVLGQIISG